MAKSRKKKQTDQDHNDHAAEFRKQIEESERAKPYTSDECWRALSFSSEELESFREDAEEGRYESTVKEAEAPQVFHLHLEIIPSVYFNDSIAAYFEDDADFRDFLRLAKAEKGISRDFLVPSDMNLHALHYAIQQAFGWYNSHLHRFCLREEDYYRLTAGRFGGFMDLCGILFRGNSEDTNDLYWDNDYLPSSNFKSWLRKKYKRPFCHYAVTDSRFGARDFISKMEEVFPDASPDMWTRLINMDISDDLMEGLRLKDLLSKDTWRSWNSTQLRKWKEEVMRETAFRDYEYEESVIRKYNKGRAQYRGLLSFGEALDRVREDLDELKAWSESASYICSSIRNDYWNGSDAGKDDIREQTGMEPEEALAGNMRMVRSYRRKLRSIFEDYVILPRPFTDEILYQYDYGDDWCLRISLVEGLSVDDPSASPECRIVHETGKPVCIAADGVNLIDDVGGITGFKDFLKAIYGNDAEEKKHMLEWSSGFGWKGTLNKPQKIL